MEALRTLWLIHKFTKEKESELMESYKNIQFVSDEFLCNSCGACAAVCPTDAIDFKENRAGYFFARVDADKCIDCEICIGVCSGLGMHPSVLDKLPSNPFVGQIEKSLAGYSTDDDIYNNSQSGGIVTAVLANQLRTGKIDGVIQVKMASGMRPRAKAFIATSAEELKNGQKSKYCPVPILTLFKELNKCEGKYAFAGTACQLHGLLNILERYPKYKDKLAFSIGLFCESVLTYKAVDYLLKRSHIQGSIEDFAFKDKSISPYPGDVMLKNDKGEIRTLPSKKRIWIKDLLTPLRCRLCFDKLNVLADISVGDPHGIASLNKTNGESLVLIRTSKGAELMEDLRASGEAAFHEVDMNSALKGQLIETKKQDWLSFSNSWFKMDKRMPDFYTKVAASIQQNYKPKDYRLELYCATNAKGPFVDILIIMGLIRKKFIKMFSL
ncbi:MAG TPA: hypothetical protein DDW62_09105 [Marinilabiliaceae bacterium]|nr:hypothetical protein [Marinilabiliaceae bacterium]